MNTADSKAELRFNLSATGALPEHLKARAHARLEGRMLDGVLLITASEHRSQLDNRRSALARLSALLIEAIAPPAAPRRPRGHRRERSPAAWSPSSTVPA